MNTLFFTCVHNTKHCCQMYDRNHNKSAFGIYDLHLLCHHNKNKSVGNDGVAFVKGANERNESFSKIKQTVIYDEQFRTNKAKD